MKKHYTLIICSVTCMISIIISPLNFAAHNDNPPVWEIGDNWTYHINNVEINIDNDDMFAHILLVFDDVSLELTQDSGDTYTVKLSTRLNGDFSVRIDAAQIKISGQFAPLLPTKLNGILSVDKSSLGLKNVALDVSAYVKAKIAENPVIPISLPSILIPAKINAYAGFENPFALLDFPMDVFKTWGVSENEISVDGIIQSIWLRLFNVINNILTRLNIELIPQEIAQFFPEMNIPDILAQIGFPSVIDVPPFEPLFFCLSDEMITVDAGSYDTYNVTIGIPNTEFDFGHFYYAPAAGKIIKMLMYTSRFSDISDIYIELIDTNYG